MTLSFDQILPSLESFGLWSYWLIGLAALLEAIFVTGVLIPGTLVVDAGGILVQQGALDFFDLIWFVAIGSAIGGQVSFGLGGVVLRRYASRWRPEESPRYLRAKALFDRHGGLALVIGRFLGPVSGLVPLAASLSEMPRHKFLIWNVLSSIAYALAHVSLGYFVGDVAFRLSPLVTRVGLFVGAVLLALVLLWWVVVRLIRILPFVISVLTSIGTAIVQNPDVRRWTDRHPRLTTFLIHRFDRDTFSGLTATFLTGAGLYILFIWMGSVFDFLMLEPIVFADTRLANLIHAFWAPDFLRLAAYITGLGDWRVLLPLALAATAGTLSARRPDLFLGMIGALALDLVLVGVLKNVFNRPRPDLRYFVETTNSFPSGHAAISISFYSFLFFILWRLKLLRALPAAIGAVTLAFFVGLSRVYLIEHYLSDVLNGWMVGALCLIIGIALAEWMREARSLPLSDMIPAKHRGMAIFAVTVLSGVALWQVATYDKDRNVPTASTADISIASVEELVASGGLPVQTESIIGAPLEPINVIILAHDTATLTDRLIQAGWLPAKAPGVSTLVMAAIAAWTNQADANAPVTPYFWQSLPNDLAFEKTTSVETVRRRHHVRFWRTRYVTREGFRVFLGAASFDDGLDWGLLHHIAPNIDTERDLLASDIQAAKSSLTDKAVEITRLRVSEPRLGKSIAGDPWFSDGAAILLTFP